MLQKNINAHRGYRKIGTYPPGHKCSRQRTVSIPSSIPFEMIGTALKLMRDCIVPQITMTLLFSMQSQSN